MEYLKTTKYFVEVNRNRRVQLNFGKIDINVITKE
jgi:hypothetical protein